MGNLMSVGRRALVLAWVMLLGLSTVPVAVAQSATGLDRASSEHAAVLRDAALGGSGAYDIVESLTTEVGPRLAGTEAEARARAWALAQLQELGFEQVRVESFELETWVRGEERAVLLSPFPQPLVVTTLGGSVATPEEGLEAELVIFDSFDALKAAPPDSLQGRIAYVGHAMQRTQDGTGYGFYGSLRRQGANVAAQKGAVALLIRSIGTGSHRLPHTGQMDYEDSAPRIPAAALSNPDADQLERIAARGRPLRLRLLLTPRMIGTTESGNVIAEIRGRESPEELVLISAHLDSWDLGTGAVDDGAGVAIATAAARLILDSGKRPRRTIRLVLWGAEEVKIKGALAYVERHRDSLARHLIGAESDFGAGRVWKMSARVAPPGQAVLEEISRLLAPLGVAWFGVESSRSGGDLKPLVGAGMAPFHLWQDGTDYFDLHHTADDTLDKIDAADLDQNVAAFAVFAWLAAESTVDFRPPAQETGSR